MERKVDIFDTTLRDGEQSPGASLTGSEKLEIARQLARMKVDVIEAGFPSSSPGDFEAVRQIAKTVKGPVVTALARAVKTDIDAVWESVREAERPRIHIVLGSSDIHAQNKFGKSREELLQMGVEAVRYAKTLCPDVEYSTEDGSRSDRDYLCQVIEAVIEAGATVVNVPDTVGWAMPAEWERLISYIRRNVSNMDKAILSTHCHNDMGLAVANSLAAVKAGAQQVECTINGIGERAGNASLEELVMALKARGEYFDATSGVVSEELCRSSRLVSRMTGLTVARNKAIVGANAFAHSSGIHQDGVLKNRNNYEIFSPAEVGADGTQIVLTARSGRHAVRHRLSELGYEVTQQELDRLHPRFLAIADAKKEVFDDDLHALMADVRGSDCQAYSLQGLQVICGTDAVPSATVRLQNGDVTIEKESSGNGPIDACFKAIDAITDLPVKLVDYKLNAATAEKGAVGEAQVVLKSDARTATGRGASTDVIEASARAYVNAVNRLVV